MIPAYVPAEAVFVTNKVTHTLPVHAWSDSGDAFVLKDRKMMRASMLDGFQGVRDRRQIVGVVPGGGWMTEWEGDGDSSFADPVVAWAVYADGHAVSIDTDSTGEGIPLEPESKGRRTYHPGQVADTSQQPAGDAPSAL